jgi:predicted SprT family Zn-dependent metalloprotease
VHNLSLIFESLNVEFFDGFLPEPELAWNSRLRTSAGRFFPGVRRGIWARPARIEVASYLREEAQAAFLIRDTLGHEMIHYWLWERRRPYGHTEEFYVKMRAMGVNRYNTVPRERPYKYTYFCPACRKAFPARRRLRVLACADCCRQYNGGKFHPRFQLALEGASS